MLIIGNTYGQLTAVSFYERRSNKDYYNFVCSCGKYHIAEKWNVIYRNTTSCGCKSSRVLKKGKPTPPHVREKISKSHIGLRHTEETKKKISEVQKGRTPPNKGVKMSPELIEKNRLGHIGIKPTLEARINKSNATKGEKSCHWRGGINDINDTIRKSLEATIWRGTVFDRDKFSCQECGTVGGRLNAHHIKEFAKRIDLRFHPDNGVTLCLDCHRNIHTAARQYGKTKGSDK
jgi:hypothetical protein